ncbi:hypothetical protein [Kocuria sp. UCD-OTCP]|uniref:hypothetical protein n=1 Tax=Kocuria sp. UCD-OTCP TaxID=1292021 RepID=UPI000381DFAA|nr:hypothetical protein [Kocuria sp. UCD-OTCP]EYT48027.1 hypothetical protein H488_0116545 [Kocuria sp. UCD-OTCP]
MPIQERLAEFTRLHDLDDIQWSAPIPQLPSPSWWASDNILIRGESKTLGRVIAKVMSRHAWSWRNRHSMIQAAVAAGENGVGPVVHAHDQEIGILVVEELTDDWRVVRLDYYADPDFRSNLLSTRRAFAALDLNLTPRSPIVELTQLEEECRDRGISLDPRVTSSLEQVLRFKEALLDYRSSVEFQPSQGEATSSNLMVHRDGRVKIVGWGSAAQLSQVHDTALLVSEACPTVLSSEALIREVLPESTAKDIAVIQLISLIEHLRWALLASLRAATDPDENLDSIKYGLWRMTLAEIALADHELMAGLEKELS